MFKRFITFLRNYRQNKSGTKDNVSGINSEDDDEIDGSTTIGENHPVSPIITGKLMWSANEREHALLRSSFAMLPTEIIIQIFQLLSVHDLGNVALVCRHFKMIADQDDIWRSKCNPSNKIQSKSYKQIYIDWVYGKYLRNRKLKKMNNIYKKTRQHVPCLPNICHCSSEYLSQIKNKTNNLSVSGFTEHPNSSLDMTIELSVDIDRSVIALIAFMEKASKFVTRWCRNTVLKQMIMRYYRFLQLKTLYPKERLIPTLDIEIIWHTHLLRPEMYRGDCLRLFGRIIDHSLLIDDNVEGLKEQAFANTCRLYEEYFRDQYCPLPANTEGNDFHSIYRHSLLNYIECHIPAYSYWDHTQFKFASDVVDTYENPFSFVETDVILDSYWFDLYFIDMYRVGLKIIAHNSQTQQMALRSAMKRLKKSYERFLYMTGKYSTMNGYECLHPTYAIDLAWHSHMQEPLKYAKDCERLLGFILDHVPWSSIKTTDQIAQSQKQINDIWTKEFNRDMETDNLE